MTVPARTASKLLNKTELELYKAGTKAGLKSLTPARLKQKVALARKLRDKWRDEAKRQNRETRGKGKPRGKTPAMSSENTQLKAQIFEELLTAFDGALAAATAPKVTRSSVADKRSGVPKSVRGGKGAGKARGAAGAKGAAGKGKVKPASAGKLAKKKAAANKAGRLKAGVKRTLSHMSAAGKRRQGVKDIKSARARGG